MSALRPRVLHVVTAFDPAGAERIVLAICRLARRVDVEAAALLDGTFRSAFEEAGVPVHVLGMRGKWDLGVVARLVRLLRDRRPDVVHTHLVHAHVVGRLAARRVRVPTVATTHVVEERFRPWHRWAERWTSRWCRVTVGVTQAVCAHLIERVGLPAARVRCIPNGIDLERFRPGEGERDIDVLFVGRLVPQKGLDLALPHLPRGLRTCVAGSGGEQSALREQAERLGLEVEWLGHRDDVAELMARARVLIVPSRWEGFGLTLAEGLASGCHVVFEPIPPLLEVAGSHGHALSTSAATYGETVRRLAEGAPAGEEGRAHVEARHGEAAMVRAYEELYLEVSRRRSSSGPS